MQLVKPIFRLRRRSHLETRLELRDERVYAYRLIPYLASVNILFGFVDWFSITNPRPLVYFGVRIGVVIASRVFYLISRGRLPYGTRLFLTVAPYLFGVEYIMIANNLSFTPYYAGLSLVMITSTMLFPVRARIAGVVYTICILPILIWLYVHPATDVSESLNMALMAIGSVFVCMVNSGQVWTDTLKLYETAEILARNLGKREKEIRQKAEELVKRRTFETQFSPQVVSAVLHNNQSVREMRNQRVMVLVVDIENSTAHAKAIDPKSYKAVIEEVFDVFASACLKWNVTVDKFTGDGAQAFAGAPVSDQNDLWRALMAGRDTAQMLIGRRSELEGRWRTPLNVRFAVCEGQALVGFLGRGTLKSFTAIGDTVSLTHRLCSVADPWSIVIKANVNSDELESRMSGFPIEFRQISSLKGFGDSSFRVAVLRIDTEAHLVIDNGRCTICETPLVIEDGLDGLPKLFCPGCETRNSQAA